MDVGNIKVSIVTVCYNAEKTIEQTIKSVIGQTYQHMEYIIVDGASSDDTLKIIDQYRNLIDIVISEPDSGLYEAMNKGIKIASGDVIGLLNADDWYEPDAVECIVKRFQRFDHIGVISGRIRFIDKDRVIGTSKHKDIQEIWKKMPIAHPAAFIRRDVYRAIGLYDTSFKISADYDFVFRCYLKGIKFAYLDDILTNFRISGISGTRHLEMYKEDERILNRYGKYCADSSVVKDALLQEQKLLAFWTANHDEISQVLDTDSNTYIFGSGYWGNMLASVLVRADISFDGFIDNEYTKQGLKMHGHRVFAPVILEKCPEDSKVIIAVKDAFADIKIQISQINSNVKVINYTDFIDRLYDLKYKGLLSPAF